MAEYAKTITVKQCDFCEVTESVVVGGSEETAVAIDKCDNCGKRACMEHIKHLQLNIQGIFQSEQMIYTYLCPDCKLNLQMALSVIQDDYKFRGLGVSRPKED